MRGRRRVFYLILMAGLLAIIWASYRSFSVTSAPSEKALGELLSALDSNQVAQGTFNADGNRVDWKDQSGASHRTYYPVGYQLVDRFAAQHVSITVEPSSSSNVFLTVVLPNLILFLVIAGFMWYMLRTVQRGGGGGIKFGGSGPPS